MTKEWRNGNYDPNEVVDSQDGDDSHSRHSKDRKGKRKFYTSNVPGMFIVNAVTGIAYPWRVGSLYEDFLWKICDARGKYGKLDPDFYFYDSPKQAIDHRRYRANAFSEEAIESWKMKVSKMTKMCEDD